MNFQATDHVLMAEAFERHVHHVHEGEGDDSLLEAPACAMLNIDHKYAQFRRAGAIERET